MSMKEDLLVIVRGILKRPVESLLLIIGIALGIGATASGISIVAQSVKESDKLLNETRYREIVVKTRESAAEMDLPASITNTENQVFLTANDLAAKKEVPAIEYAYVANRRGLNFRDFRNMPGFQSSEGGGGEIHVLINNPPQTGNDVPPPDLPTVEFGNSAPAADILPGDPGLTAGSDQGVVTDKDSQEGLKPVVEEITAYEVSPEYFAAYGLTAAQGSLFTDEDIRKREPLLILGSEIAKTLFADGVSMGRRVQDHDQLLKIVGILDATGTDLDKAGFTPTAIPDPNSTDPRLRFRGWNTNLRFTVKDGSKLEEARTHLISWFEQAYGIGSIVLSVPREEAEELADRNSRLVTIILILAVSGLLIASVNVSNILYSRALRKRKAIGILKAMGATRMHIFTLFFTEALIIGLMGALAGTGVAVLLSGLMKSSLGIGGYSIGILGIGVLLSLAITLFLTNIPAMQSSKISASDAIRYE